MSMFTVASTKLESRDFDHYDEYIRRGYMHNTQSDLVKYEMDNGYSWRSDPAPRDTAHVTATETDKHRCVVEHQHSRNRRQLLNLITSDTFSFPGWKTITLPELKRGQSHCGRILFGKFCVQPFQNWSVNTAVSENRSNVDFRFSSAVHTVLEDENGRGVQLMILAPNTSTRELEVRFPLGMRVAITEPLLTVCGDEKTVVLVHNPSDVICIHQEGTNVNRNISSPPGFSKRLKRGTNMEHNISTPLGFPSGPNRILEELETIWCEGASRIVEELCNIRYVGDWLFGEEDWVGAENKYSDCIRHAAVCGKETEDKLNELLMLADSNREEARLQSESFKANLQDMLKQDLMLAYSNRAEARLWLQDFGAALSDAEKALEFNSNDVDILVCKGEAAYRLGLYEKSWKAFKAAVEQSPDEQSILKGVIETRSRTTYPQSQAGAIQGQLGIDYLYGQVMGQHDVPLLPDPTVLISWDSRNNI